MTLMLLARRFDPAGVLLHGDVSGYCRYRHTVVLTYLHKPMDDPVLFFSVTIHLSRGDGNESPALFSSHFVLREIARSIVCFDSFRAYEVCVGLPGSWFYWAGFTGFVKRRRSRSQWFSVCFDLMRCEALVVERRRRCVRWTRSDGMLDELSESLRCFRGARGAGFLSGGLCAFAFGSFWISEHEITAQDEELRWLMLSG